MSTPVVIAVITDGSPDSFVPTLLALRRAMLECRR
jgi:hypothetical protein